MRALPPQLQRYNCLRLFLNSAHGCSLINITPHEHSISKLWAAKQDLSPTVLPAHLCYHSFLLCVSHYNFIHLSFDISRLNFQCQKPPYYLHTGMWDGVSVSGAAGVAFRTQLVITLEVRRKGWGHCFGVVPQLLPRIPHLVREYGQDTVALLIPASC